MILTKDQLDTIDNPPGYISTALIGLGKISLNGYILIVDNMLSETKFEKNSGSLYIFRFDTPIETGESKFDSIKRKLYIRSEELVTLRPDTVANIYYAVFWNNTSQYLQYIRPKFFSSINGIRNLRIITYWT